MSIRRFFPFPEQRAWLWPGALMATIFFASGHGQVAAPQIVGFDKVAHFFVFGLLATLFGRCRAVAACPPLRLGTAVALTSLYGALDEFHQRFTPGRSAGVPDWIADTLGAAVAVAVYARWVSYQAALEWPSMPIKNGSLNPSHSPS